MINTLKYASLVMFALVAFPVVLTVQIILGVLWGILYSIHDLIHDGQGLLIAHKNMLFTQLGQKPPDLRLEDDDAGNDAESSNNNTYPRFE